MHISHRILSEVSVRNIERESRGGCAERTVQVMWAEGSGTDQGDKCAERSCAHDRECTTQVFNIRGDGIFEREDSDQVISRAERANETILGEAHMGTRILCINGRVKRGTGTQVREVATRS